MTEQTPNLPGKSTTEISGEQKQKWKKVVTWIGIAAVSVSIVTETARHFDPTYHGDEVIETCTGVDTEALAVITDSTYAPVSDSVQNIEDLSNKAYPNKEHSSWNAAVNYGNSEESPYGVPAASVVRITNPDDTITTGVVLETKDGHVAVVTAGDYRGETPESFTLGTWDRPSDQLLTPTGGCTLVDPNDPTKITTAFTVRRVNHFSDVEEQLNDATSHTNEIVQTTINSPSAGEPLLTIAYTEESRPGVPETETIFPFFAQSTPETPGGHFTGVSNIPRNTQNGQEPKSEPLDQSGQGAPLYQPNEGMEGGYKFAGIVASVDSTPLTSEQLVHGNIHATNPDDLHSVSIIGPAQIEATLNSEYVRNAYNEKPLIDYPVELINDTAHSNPVAAALGGAATFCMGVFGRQHFLRKNQKKS